MIKYKKITNGAINVQARQLSGGRCTGKDIAGIIEKEIGIPAIRTMSVLNALSEVIARQLAEGNNIHIDGLGILKVGISMENGKAVAKRLCLTPSSEIKNVLSAIQFKEITD